MPAYTYDPGLVFDDSTGLPSKSATGQLLDRAGGTPQPVYDLLGNLVANLTTSPDGYLARFKADVPTGVVTFGSVAQPVVCVEAQNAAPQAAAAQAAAEKAATAAQAAADAAQSVQAGTFTGDASQVTSGTFSAARIPSLPASQITSGAFAAARIPDLSGTYATTLVAAGKVAKGDLVINVKDYGAKGDGTTDDSAAINAALAVAGPKVVVFPPATYKAAGLILRGDTTVMAYGATIRYAGASWFVRNYGPTEVATVYNGQSRINVLGGVWDANSSAPTNGFTFFHCQDITVRDATIKNIVDNHGIEFNACKNGRAINCNFYGFTAADASRTYAECIQIDMAYSGTPPTYGAWDDTPCSNILVDGCTFGPSETAGNIGRAVGTHTSRPNVYHEHIRIQNCYVAASQSAGIRGYQWRDVVIANNQIENSTGDGILIQPGDPAGSGGGSNAIDRITVSHNIIKGATGYGVEIFGYTGAKVLGAKVDNNQMQSCYRGVVLTYADDATVTENHIFDATNCGITLTTCSRPKVTGGRIARTGSTGVSVDTCPSTIVSGISLSNVTANYGIVIGTSADSMVRNCRTESTTPAAFRFTGTSPNCSLIGNVARVGTGANVPMTNTATPTGLWYTGNDFRGMAAIVDASTSPVSSNNL